jgi:hypothetical protein
MRWAVVAGVNVAGDMIDQLRAASAPRPER